MNRSHWLDILDSQLNRSEVRTLCFDLKVDYDNLAGETKREKLSELLLRLEREHRTRDLVEVLRGQRPDIQLELTPSDESPYVGLRTFDEEHAHLFFGREVLIADLVERVSDAPFLAVLGPSGSGKSSVVRAGLIPELKKGALPGSDAWRYLTLKPGPRPLDALAAVLAKAQGGGLGGASTIRQALVDDERALLLAADMLLTDESEGRLVLVVDQFEELWTQSPSPDNRQSFIQVLLSALSPSEGMVTGPLLVIVTMRADFLHRAADHRELARAIGEFDVIVSPMTEEELKRAIVRPARVAGGDFEPGLVEELIEQTLGREGALPLLEYTLLELWKTKRHDGVMTWERYRTLGGVEGALAARADQILERHYEPAQRRTLRTLLLRLVQPGERNADSRRRALLADIKPAESSAEEVEALLQPFVAERLLTMGATETGDETVEVSHEALLRAWPTLAEWIDEAREELRLQLQVEEAAREWEASERNPDYLWRGLPLANAEAWMEEQQGALNEREVGFLRESRAVEDQRQAEAEAAEQERERLAREREEEEKRARRNLRFAAMAALLLLAAVFFAWQANQQRRAAAAAQTEAEALKLAFASLTEQEVNAERAHLLAIEANRLTYTPVGDEAIRTALRRAGRTIQILADLEGGVTSVAWSPDGTRILTTSYHGMDCVWDVTSGDKLITLHIDASGTNSAAWAPNGTRIVTVSNNGTARVSDAITGVELAVLRSHRVWVTSATWSPDSSRILTTSEDATARVWNPSSGDGLTILHGHEGWISSATWSPDGKRILTASGDGTARVWEASFGTELAVLRGHEEEINSAAWSFDGRRILTASRDGTARVWEAASGIELIVLRGHEEEVNSATWSPDGRRILTHSEDGTARVWEAGFGTELVVLHGREEKVDSAVWSPDGSHLLTTRGDSTAHIWEVASGTEITILQSHDNGIESAVWSPDSSRVLTISNIYSAGHDFFEVEEGIARVSEVGFGAELVVLSDYLNDFLNEVNRGVSTTWTPDSGHIITVESDDTVRVWNDVESRSMVLHLSSIEGGMNQATLSPDGKRILTYGGDGTARIWDTVQGEELLVLGSYDEHSVTFAAWSPDGTRVLTASNDSTARVWDVTLGTELAVLRGHTEPVTSAAWSSDGTRILTGSDDGTARIHYANIEDLLRVACERAVRNLSHDEWAQFIGDGPYEETCPGKPVPGVDYAVTEG